MRGVVMRLGARLGVLLALVAAMGVACTGDGETPPCTPLVEGGADPCDGNIAGITTVNGSGWFGDEPWSIRSTLDGGIGTLYVSHFAVRGSYVDGSVRCQPRKEHRIADHIGIPDFAVDGMAFLQCYADLQVADYLVGSGPTKLTVVVQEVWWGTYDVDANEIARRRSDAERALTQGGWHFQIKNVPTGGITGVESIFFIGPAADVSVESWEVMETWDVERKTDGTVVAVHPVRYVFIRRPDYETAFKAQAEPTIPALKLSVQAAQASRIADYDGHVEDDPDTPRVVTNANNLSQFYVDAGETAMTMPPPACGLAVPDYLNNAGLVRDCETLLAVKDALRGTGTLNWSVDVSMAEWDGVAVAGAPQRVTRLELADRSLTGSIPASLARLELVVLKLSGNALTGCVPSALREVSEHDLDSLGLPECE